MNWKAWNWKSKRFVILGLVAVSVVLFGGGMNPTQRRRAYLAIAAVIIAMFGAGLGYWVAFGQHHQICADGRPPKAEQDQLLEPTLYQCHNGQVVTSSGLP